jgi:hypothetical protein
LNSQCYFGFAQNSWTFPHDPSFTAGRGYRCLKTLSRDDYNGNAPYVAASLDSAGRQADCGIGYYCIDIDQPVAPSRTLSCIPDLAHPGNYVVSYELDYNAADVGCAGMNFGTLTPSGQPWEGSYAMIMSNSIVMLTDTNGDALDGAHWSNERVKKVNNIPPGTTILADVLIQDKVRNVTDAVIQENPVAPVMDTVTCPGVAVSTPTPTPCAPKQPIITNFSCTYVGTNKYLANVDWSSRCSIPPASFKWRAQFDKNNLTDPAGVFDTGYTTSHTAIFPTNPAFTISGGPHSVYVTESNGIPAQDQTYKAGPITFGCPGCESCPSPTPTPISGMLRYCPAP